MSDLATLPLDALVIDPAPRPAMPPIPGATEGERRKGRHLAVIHRHYLSEMSQVAAVLDRIRAGDAPPQRLEQIILHSDMRRNLEAAGTICGQQCQVLTMHHNIEEFHMFAGLEAPGNAALTAVVAQLRAEHKVVHELLNRLGEAARALSAEPTEAGFEAAYEIFQRLRAAVVSHFGYEETELAEAIGHYLDDI